LTRAPSCGDDHNVRIPWQPQDYTRTCARCGSTWKVPGPARGWWRSRKVNRSLARCAVIAGLLAGASQENADSIAESPLCGSAWLSHSAIVRNAMLITSRSVHQQASCLTNQQPGARRACVRILRTRRGPGDISCRGLRRSHHWAPPPPENVSTRTAVRITADARHQRPGSPCCCGRPSHGDAWREWSRCSCSDDLDRESPGRDVSPAEKTLSHLSMAHAYSDDLLAQEPA
jgi:hypothetical protein